MLLPAAGVQNTCESIETGPSWLFPQIGGPFCGRPYSKSPILFGVYIRGRGNSHAALRRYLREQVKGGFKIVQHFCTGS